MSSKESAGWAASEVLGPEQAASGSISHPQPEELGWPFWWAHCLGITFELVGNTCNTTPKPIWFFFSMATCKCTYSIYVCNLFTYACDLYELLSVCSVSEWIDFSWDECDLRCVYFFHFKTNHACSWTLWSLARGLWGVLKHMGIKFWTFILSVPELECCMQGCGWTTQFSVQLFRSAELPCRSSTEILSYGHYEVGPSREANRQNFWSCLSKISLSSKDLDTYSWWLWRDHSQNNWIFPLMIDFYGMLNRKSRFLWKG